MIEYSIIIITVFIVLVYYILLDVKFLIYNSHHQVPIFEFLFVFHLSFPNPSYFTLLQLCCIDKVQSLLLVNKDLWPTIQQIHVLFITMSSDTDICI